MNAERAKSTGKFVRMRRSTDWSWFTSDWLNQKGHEFFSQKRKVAIEFQIQHKTTSF